MSYTSFNAGTGEVKTEGVSTNSTATPVPKEALSTEAAVAFANGQDMINIEGIGLTSRAAAEAAGIIEKGAPAPAEKTNGVTVESVEGQDCSVSEPSGRRNRLLG